MYYHRLKKMDAKAQRGKRTLNFLISDEKRKRLGAFLKNRSREKMVTKADRQRQSHLNDLVHTCLKHITPVTAPLVLISQARYSGGALLNSLFDGHPQIYAHPHTLTIGYPDKHLWPVLDLDDKPQHWFEILFEETLIEQIEAGCRPEESQALSQPFVFLPLLQKRIFLAYLDSLKAISPSDVFQAYMTAYFGAWLNYRNQGQPKKIVSAFSPRLALEENNMASFFEVYPNGKLISLVREPLDWFSSVSGSEPEFFGDVQSAMAVWEKNARAMLRNKQRHGDHVCLIKFEDLVTRTESVMRFLAGFLTLQFDDVLMTPSFNSAPILSADHTKMESSDTMQHHTETKSPLGDDVLNVIREMSSESYQLVLRETTSF